MSKQTKTPLTAEYIEAQMHDKLMQKEEFREFLGWILTPKEIASVLMLLAPEGATCEGFFFTNERDIKPRVFYTRTVATTESVAKVLLAAGGRLEMTSAEAERQARSFVSYKMEGMETAEPILETLRVYRTGEFRIDYYVGCTLKFQLHKERSWTLGELTQ